MFLCIVSRQDPIKAVIKVTKQEKNFPTNGLLGGGAPPLAPHLLRPWKNFLIQKEGCVYRKTVFLGRTLYCGKTFLFEKVVKVVFSKTSVLRKETCFEKESVAENAGCGWHLTSFGRGCGLQEMICSLGLGIFPPNANRLFC